MNLNAFYIKFHEKKDEIPPGACRPSNKIEKNNVEQVDPRKVNKKTMSSKWTPKKLEQKAMCSK